MPSVNSAARIGMPRSTIFEYVLFIAIQRVHIEEQHPCRTLGRSTFEDDMDTLPIWHVVLPGVVISEQVQNLNEAFESNFLGRWSRCLGSSRRTRIDSQTLYMYHRDRSRF